MSTLHYNQTDGDSCGKQLPHSVRVRLQRKHDKYANIYSSSTAAAIELQ